MKKKYRNRLPKGAEVTGFSAHVENGELIVDVEFKDKFLPKDGDFLASSLGNVFIYSDKKAEYDDRYCCYCGIYNGGEILTHFSNYWTNKIGCRFATSKEKADFLKRLETEKHLRWDSESKELVTTRWRANDGEYYYYINSGGNIQMGTEWHTCDDNIRYEAGNYCRFEDELVPYAEQVKEIYKKLK